MTGGARSRCSVRCRVGCPSAGAPYQLPSLFSEHAQGPVYKQEFESPKHTQDNGMPHPSKVRRAATEQARSTEPARGDTVRRMRGAATALRPERVGWAVMNSSRMKLNQLECIPVSLKRSAHAPHALPCSAALSGPQDRTAWMIGITKNDLAYYSNIAGNMGPAF